MTRRAALLLAALVAAAGVLVGVRPGTAPARPSHVAAAAPAPGATRSRAPETSVDPATIRDLFRFASRPTASREPLPAHAARQAKAASPGPDLPRLVGLVRRQGRLLAAFAAGGDVVLAGPGDAVFGLTVLEVGEEAVRVRRPDGAEERLALP